MPRSPRGALPAAGLPGRLIGKVGSIVWFKIEASERVIHGLTFIVEAETEEEARQKVDDQQPGIVVFAEDVHETVHREIDSVEMIPPDEAEDFKETEGAVEL